MRPQEKLTEERAQAYAGEKSISFDRAMTRIKHVSTKTAWDDVTAEMEDLQADGTTRVFLREPGSRYRAGRPGRSCESLRGWPIRRMRTSEGF